MLSCKRIPWDYHSAKFTLDLRLFPRFKERIMLVILSFLVLFASQAGSNEVGSTKAGSNEVLEEFEPKRDSLLFNQTINLRQEWKLSFQVRHIYVYIQLLESPIPTTTTTTTMSQKASSGDISGTKHSIIDPLV